MKQIKKKTIYSLLIPKAKLKLTEVLQELVDFWGVRGIGISLVIQFVAGMLNIDRKCREK